MCVIRQTPCLILPQSVDNFASSLIHTVVWDLRLNYCSDIELSTVGA